MNLQSEIREVRARVSEPARLNPDNPYITDIEIIDWIFRGEIQVSQDIQERERLVKIQTTAAVAAQELYDAPADLLDIVRITYAGTECTRASLLELGSLTSNRYRAPKKGVQQFFYEIAKSGVTPGVGQIGIRPIPDDTQNILIYYVPVPVRRYKAVDVKTTSNGSTTTTISTSLTAYPDNFWNNTQIRWLNGANRGNFKAVTGFTSATGTVTHPANDIATTTGIEFEMGQVSSLPQEYIPLVIAWAAYQALMKDRRPDLAQIYKTEYEAQLTQVNGRYGYSRTEPAREAIG